MTKTLNLLATLNTLKALFKLSFPLIYLTKRSPVELRTSWPIRLINQLKYTHVSTGNKAYNARTKSNTAREGRGISLLCLYSHLGTKVCGTPWLVLPPSIWLPEWPPSLALLASIAIKLPPCTLPSGSEITSERRGFKGCICAF